MGSAIKNKTRRRKIGRRVFSVLVAAVVFVTTYALVIPVITASASAYCGMEEHTHSDACYEDVLICGLEEGGAGEDAHVHDDSCYEKQLVCGVEEHTHDLSCYSDPEADVELTEQWEATIPKKLSGYYAQDLVAVAKSQVTYNESEKNYEVAADGVGLRGYTRYGDWNDEPYANWSMDFVAFSLFYAGIDEKAMPINTESEEDWIDDLTKAGLIKEIDPDVEVSEGIVGKAVSAGAETDAEQTYATGDLVFLEPEDENGEEVPHMGILVKQDKKNITLIEGDRDNEVAKTTYAKDSEKIIAVAALPDQEAEVAADAVASEDMSEPDEDVDAAIDEATTDDSIEEDDVSDTEEELAAEETENEDTVDDAETEEDSDEDAAVDEEQTVLTYEGDDFTVTATFGKDAGFSEDTTLSVSEIRANGKWLEKQHYKSYFKQSKDALQEEGSSLVSARFFDITFLDGKKKIEPTDDVNISITYKKDKDQTENTAGTTIRAIHLPDNADAKVIDTDANMAGSGAEETVSFTADSFSVYGVVYTVDFHWEVDGKTYDFSIPGGGYVSLEQLVEVLGIAENDTQNEDGSAGVTDAKDAPDESVLTLDTVQISEETKKFVANVENVEFSTPDLLSISKAEEDTTVGAVKDHLGLACEYSSELTEEDIAKINASEVKSGDWALISLKAFVTEEALTVSMKDGEVFTIKVTDARDPLGLDGRTFAIVNQRNGNWYALRGAQNTTQRQNRGYYLYADGVSHTISNNTEYCGIGGDAWLFEYNAAEDAYYVSCNGLYLYIDPSVTSKDGTPDHALNLVTDKNQPDKGTLIKITKDSDGNYVFKSNSEGITLWDYNNGWYWLDNGSGNEGKMRLCLPEDSGSNASHKATLISAADTQNGQKIIVYQRVLDPETDTFTYYAINGVGGMEKVYNSSDAVYWKGNLNIEWTLQELGNGYYTLYNEATDTYLTPKASTGGDGSYVIHKASDFDDSKHLSIALPGRDDGTYTSLISCWDYVDNATYGLKASEVTVGSQGKVEIEPLLSSQQFYFAARDPIVHDQLTTVDTVDSVSKGIKITMYDWGNELGLDSHRQKWDAYDWNNQIIQDRLPMMQAIMGDSDSYADKYESGYVKPGILAAYIDEENGQTAPNILKEDGTENGHNLSELFSNRYIRRGTEAEKVNHLFLQSVYDETGFYKYSCFENYAYLPEGNDFVVYEQIGTPSNRTVNDYQATNIIFERGNFMPYNPINAAMDYRQNNYDPDLKELPNGDPRKGERLYYIENALPAGERVWYNGAWHYGFNNPEAYANYYIGMKLEAKFSQNPGGYADNGDPMVFEFNGDDDMWVYLDNVLVLDLGGVHDAFRGRINFRTGEVTCNALNGENTTIKAMFKSAGRFPDGTAWDDNRVDEYFRGNTFKDLSTHTFKMFYMERGASASDLELMFNLPVLTESQFRIKKELPETNDGEEIQSQYGDAPFYYKAYVYDADQNEMVPCTRKYLQDKNLGTPKYEDGGEVKWLTDNENEEIFLINPGQTAEFPAVDDSVRWYTEEVSPPGNENMLKKFSVSNSDQDNTYEQGETGVRSKERTIQVRNMVIYQNRPDTELVNELQIKKRITGEAYEEDDAFEYRIFLEKTDGKLGVYRLGEYYQFDKDNNFVFYENGVRHTAKMEVLSNGQYRYYEFDDNRPEETVEKQKITEHTSANGSLGDVRDGDTIIIKGLLVGTDFYVYERTDYDYMSPDATLIDGKYVFLGTEVTDAYTRDPETNKPENEFVFNSLYEDPDREVLNNYTHTAYEREKAASGAIVEDKDAKILVKNKPYLNIPEGTIRVEKKWFNAEGADITDSVTDKTITYDIYRLVHIHELELVVDQEPTDTESGTQHYECKHEGCDVRLPADPISPKGHNWTEWECIERPTCGGEGIWERHCTNSGCNETETWTEPALGHSWDAGTITRQPTTTQTGIRHHVCENDPTHTWDEEIPKLVGNINYHIRSMYNSDSNVSVGDYGSDGTIPAGTGNAIRVTYTLQSNNPAEKWAYGGQDTDPQNIPKTEKYVNYNYYYDYSLVIPIEEGKDLYLYLGEGYNNNRTNFKIETIEYYDTSNTAMSPVLQNAKLLSRELVPVKLQSSDSSTSTNDAVLNEKLARIGYTETDEETQEKIEHHYYTYEKYDSATQSWKADGVSTETLQNGHWSQSYTVPLTDEDGNVYEYYFVEKTMTPASEAENWSALYEGQESGLTNGGKTTISNRPSKTNVTIKKVDQQHINDDNPDLLKGAAFKLTKYVERGSSAKDTSWGVNGSLVLEDTKNGDTYALNGVFTFEGLTEGYYVLEETAFPDGYVNLSRNPAFSVTRDDSGKFVITLEDDVDGKVRLVDGELTIIVGNTPGAVLPSTGGPGTKALYLLGILLLAAAGTGLVMRKRQNERGGDLLR